MTSSYPHQLDTYARPKRAARPFEGMIGPRSRPLQRVAHEVRHVQQLEHAAESEWTPWIALAGLFIFLATIYLLGLAAVEGATHLLTP